MGRAEMFTEMVELRFGSLSPDLVERIRSADSHQLHVWSRRFVTAREIADVFDPPAAH